MSLEAPHRQKHEMPEGFTTKVINPTPENWQMLGDVVTDLETRSFPEGYAFNEKLLQKMWESERSSVITARNAQEKLVGYTIAVPLSFEEEERMRAHRSEGGRATAYVESIAIDEEFRGLGLSKMINKILDTVLSEKGFTFLEVHADVPNGYAKSLEGYYGDRVVGTRETYSDYGHKQWMRVTLPQPTEQTISLIDSHPKLQLIRKVHELAEPVKQPDGSLLHWWELGEKVKPYSDGQSLSANVRNAVHDFVAHNVPQFKEKTASKFGDFTDKQMLDAVVHNWIDVLGDDLGGQRREVLLSVAAQVVHRIESRAYQEVLKNTTDQDLQTLGLTPSQRDLTVELLHIGPRATPLFTRFMAFGHLSNKPPEEATETTMFVPKDQKRGSFSGNEQPHTLPELFSKESQFLSKRLEALSRTAEWDKENGIEPTNKEWQKEPGGELFRQYVQELSKLHNDTNPAAMAEQHETVLALYYQLLKDEYPIVLTPPVTGYTKEPYLDPELRLSLITPDTKKEINQFDQARIAMADALSELGLERFTKLLKDTKNVSVLSIGQFGVTNVWSKVAEEGDVIVLFSNEQRRAYDQVFHKYVSLFTNAKDTFGDPQTYADNEFIRSISRMNTMLHENSHIPFNEDTKEHKRLGTGEAEIIVDENKADILYRGLMPDIIEQKGLPETKEQWAVGIAASAILNLKDNAEDSPYFLNATYDLNDTFEQGFIVMNDTPTADGLFTITDYDKFYATMKTAAEELVGLYEDPTMTKEKATKWIKQRCKPNEKLQDAINTLKKSKLT